MINKKILVIAMSFMFITSIFLFIAANNRGSNIDSLPNDGLAVDIDINTQAKIIDEDSLLIGALKSVNSVNELSEDLYKYGTNAYSPYRNKETQLVGFRVDEVSAQDESVVVEGKYGASRNSVSIVIELLNYDKIKTSITDSAGFNIDSDLPSNNNRELFIGELPLTEAGFVIDYVENEDFFTINVLGETSSQEKAINTIRGKLGEEFDINNIFIYGPGNSAVNNNF